MNLDTMEITDKELEQLEIELEGFLDGDIKFYGNDAKDFALQYPPIDFESVTTFYSGFKSALYVMQRYPELLKEKEDEKKE